MTERERERAVRNRGENKTYPPPRGYVIIIPHAVGGLSKLCDCEKICSYKDIALVHDNECGTNKGINGNLCKVVTL